MMDAEAFLATTSPSGLFIAGMAIIGIMLLMRTTRRRTIQSKKPVGPPAAKRYAQLTRGTRAARSLENVLAEMDELSRDIHGRLDTKIARLEVTIRDADERIAELTRLQATIAGSPRGSASGGIRSDDPISAGSLDVTLDSESPVEFASDQTTAASQQNVPMHQPGAALRSDTLRHTTQADGAAPVSPDDTKARIHALADLSMSAEEIASELSRPVGEIELILSLRTASARLSS